MYSGTYYRKPLAGAGPFLFILLLGLTAPAGLYGQDCSATDTEPPVLYAAAPWNQRDQLLASDPSSQPRFGDAMDLSQRYAIAGASGADAGAVPTAGAAYVYGPDGNGQWTEIAKLTAGDAETGDQFGFAIASYENVVAAGAYRESEAGNLAGAVYLFTVQSNGNWQQLTKLTPTNAAAGDRFGYSLAMEGNNLAVGAPGRGGGVVYLFESDGMGNWTEIDQLTAPAGSAGDEFGAALALEGSKLVVGTPSESVDGRNGQIGRVYLFELNAASGAWEQTADMVADAAPPTGSFGRDVDVFQDRIIVGAGFARAYVFHRNATGSWDQRAILTSTAPQNASFGDRVGLYGGHAVVGSSSEDQFRGAAYVFAEDPGGGWTEVARLAADNGATDHRFGSDVAIGPGGVLVGAEGYNQGILRTGAAYAFTPVLTTTLDDATLSYCGSPVTSGAPVAYDACAGPVRGTTTDPLTFSTPGQYTVSWSFGDGNGNALAATQTVTVSSGDLTIDQVTTDPTPCPDDPQGSLTVTASCGSCMGPLQYSLDGEVYQSGNRFPDLTAGNYTVWVRDGGSPECVVAGPMVTVEDADTEAPVISGAVGDWTQVNRLTADAPAGGANYGISVALSTEAAVVGAIRGNTSATGGGAVYVYPRSTDQSLGQEIKLTVQSGSPLDRYGASVAIAGDFIAVGAPGTNTDAGAVYLYKRFTPTLWLLMATVAPSDLQAGDQYGTSVALTDNYLVVGAPQDKRSSPGVGRAYVYQLAAFGSPQLISEFSPGNGLPGDRFGSAVDAAGNQLIVGARGKSVGGQPAAGAAYVYTIASPTLVTEDAFLTAAVPLASASQGTGVAIDGDRAIMGGSGRATVFALSSLEAWTEQTVLTSSTNNGGFFGNAVALAEGTAVVGSTFENTGAFASGGAFVFSETQPGNWEEVALLGADDPAFLDALGSGVAISDGQILVGAHLKDVTGNNDAGAAYLYGTSGGGGLPDLDLTLCGAELDISPPTAQDNCAGPVTATTTDPTTFTAPGTYTVNWIFDDGNGNVSTSAQTVRVVAGGLSIDEVTTTASRCATTNGSITVVASCTSCSGDIEYSLDNQAFRADGTFSSLPPGSYTVYVRDQEDPGCTQQQAAVVNEDQPSAPVPDGVIFSEWTEGGQVGNPNSDSRHTFGIQVAMDGAYTIVGDYYNQARGEDAGAVFVYKRDATGQTELTAILHADDTAAGDLFGYSVDISGDYAVIGSFANSSVASGAGATYIFRRQSAGNWVQEAKLTAADAISFAHFGISVSIQGERVVVGARDHGETTSNRRGAAYVFERQSDGSWPQVAKLSRDAGDTGGRIGNSVAIDGDVVLVGNNIDPLAFRSAGSVYVYERSGSGQWQQTAKLRADDISGYFGYDVALSGTTALIGAPRDNEGDFSTGAAYVFVKDPVSGWTQRQKLRASNALGRSEFGDAVALDGDYAVVGASDEVSVNQSRGSAYTFYREPGTDNWRELAVLEPPVDRAFQFYGQNVAISEGYLAISAPDLNTSTPPASHLYFYTPQGDLSSQQIALCEGTATAVPPTATDNCAGPVTATTTDPTTFTAPGTYTVNWAFDDGNGNVTTATQTVAVTDFAPTLPLLETADADSPSRGCWQRGGDWGVTSAAFTLPANPAAARNDSLIGPALTLTGGQTYALTYHYRSTAAGGGGRLRAVLLDATGETVKVLSADGSLPGTYVGMDLLFDVPAEGEYRLAFVSLSAGGSPGLLLDDIELSGYTPPTFGGAELLSGFSDGLCTSVRAQGVCGQAWTRVLDENGKLLLEIDANGNDLGDVEIGMTDYGIVPTAPFLGSPLLGRYYNVTPTNGSGPYDLNGGVKIRLYFTDDELLALNTTSGQTLDWGDLAVTHYTGSDTDCDLLNSSGGEVTFETPTTTADYGQTAHYLEFTTTDFSEFGATAQSAALPIDLVTFTAAADDAVNRIHWESALEEAFSHYEVERSVDGSDFTVLTRVAGRGPGHYEATDPDPAALTYYRLRMVDLDGSYAYSPTVSVARRGASALSSLTAFPVPTADRVTLQFTATDEEPLRARLTDPLGRSVREFTVPVRPGTNTFPLDMGSLPAATYQLTLSNGRAVRTLRLVRSGR